MRYRVWKAPGVVWVGVMSVLWVGCATVDPRADYESAGRQIAQATGQASFFRPDEPEAATRRISELLEQGLTAQGAAEIALLNNPRLQVAFYEIGVARADLVESGLLSNPSLGIALRLPSGGGLSNVDFDLAQNIADLWQVPIRKRAAQQDLNRTILEVARQAASIAMDAKAAYYAAAGAKGRHQIARENLELSQRVLELTRIRREAGAGNDLDVNLARSLVMEAELALTQARLDAASALRSLLGMMGLGEVVPALTLAEPLPDPPDHNLADEALVELALAERLDLRALRQAIQGERQRLLLEIRRVFPTVEVGLAMERSERRREGGRKLLADTARSSIASGGLSVPDIQSRSERRRQGREDVITGPLLSLELPVFNQNQAAIARARFALEQSLRRLGGLERTADREVREAADRARTAWEVARFYRDEVIPLSRVNLQMAQESYRAGKSSILAVLDAQRTFLSARGRYAESLERSATVVPRLEQAVGLPIPKLLEDAASEGVGGETESGTTDPAADARPTDPEAGAAEQPPEGDAPGDDQAATDPSPTGQPTDGPDDAPSDTREGAEPGSLNPTAEGADLDPAPAIDPARIGGFRKEGSL